MPNPQTLLILTRAQGNHLGTLDGKCPSKNVRCEKGNTKKSEGAILTSCVLPFEPKTFLEGHFSSQVPNWFPWARVSRVWHKSCRGKSLRLSRGGGALENDVCGWSYLIVYVEIETSRFLILFSWSRAIISCKMRRSVGTLSEPSGVRKPCHSKFWDEGLTPLK